LTKYRIIYSSLPHKGNSPYYISTLKKQIIHHHKSPIPNAIRCLSTQKMVYYMKCLIKYMYILIYIYIYLCIYLGNLIILIRLFKCVSWKIYMYFIKAYFFGSLLLLLFRFPSSLGALLFFSTTNFELTMKFLHQFEWIGYMYIGIIYKDICGRRRRSWQRHCMHTCTVVYHHFMLHSIFIVNTKTGSIKLQICTSYVIYFYYFRNDPDSAGCPTEGTSVTSSLFVWLKMEAI
jgi:hypothetical protein